MNTDEESALTERVIGAILEVSVLGAGFLEKLYQRALLRELGLRDVCASAEASVAVSYKGQHIGQYYADILAEDVLVVELKCVERLARNIQRSVSIPCESPAAGSAFW